MTTEAENRDWKMNMSRIRIIRKREAKGKKKKKKNKKERKKEINEDEASMGRPGQRSSM